METLARAALVVKKVGGMPPEALGLWIYTLLEWSGRSGTGIDRKRFADKVAADRMGEAMEATIGLKIMEKMPGSSNDHV